MNVLEELTEFEDQIDKAHVERRVLDWEQRIDSLYTTIENWLPDNWSAKRQQTIVMNEPLMRNFDVAERHLPTLRLFWGEVSKAIFEPRGLWIIGNNGRVDLRTDSTHYIITDISENFGSADWYISSFFDRQRQRPFNQARLIETLE